jgi:nucleotide-binding universal stress UspA family protein
MYDKILVPLDGSQRAEAILRHVEGLALRFGARVIFLRVVEPAPLAMAPEMAYVRLRRNEFERRVKEAEEYLASRQGRFREIGIDAGTRIAVGPVIDGIVKVADQEDVDLIALTSHGRSGLAHVFYGSVAAGLLQRVNRSLLLVRAQAVR